jgi:hypothetical protein
LAAAAGRPADRGFAFGFGAALVCCPAVGFGFPSGFAFGAAFGFAFGAAFGFGGVFGFGFAPGVGALRPDRNNGTRSATAPGLLA